MYTGARCDARVRKSCLCVCLMLLYLNYIWGSKCSSLSSSSHKQIQAERLHPSGPLTGDELCHPNEPRRENLVGSLPEPVEPSTWTWESVAVRQPIWNRMQDTSAECCLKWPHMPIQAYPFFPCATRTDFPLPRLKIWPQKRWRATHLQRLIREGKTRLRLRLRKDSEKKWTQILKLMFCLAK